MKSSFKDDLQLLTASRPFWLQDLQRGDDYGHFVARVHGESFTFMSSHAERYPNAVYHVVGDSQSLVTSRVVQGTIEEMLRETFGMRKDTLLPDSVKEEHSREIERLCHAGEAMHTMGYHGLVNSYMIYGLIQLDFVESTFLDAWGFDTVLFATQWEKRNGLGNSLPSMRHVAAVACSKVPVEEQVATLLHKGTCPDACLLFGHADALARYVKQGEPRTYDKAVSLAKEYLAECTRLCVMCLEPYISDGACIYRPTVCTNDFCNFQYAQMSNDLLQDIRESPEVVELLVSLAYASTNDTKHFLPFPTGVATLTDCQGPTASDDDNVTAPTQDANAPKNSWSFIQDAAHVKSLIDKLPAVADMVACRTNVQLRGLLNERDRLLYPLLLWIVRSNRSQLQFLKDPMERIHGLPDDVLQFKLVTGTPEKESKFQSLRQAQVKAHCPPLPVHTSVAPVKRESLDKPPTSGFLDKIFFRKPSSPPKGANAIQKMDMLKDSQTVVQKYHGSIFAFHGSALSNWHSILRRGFNYDRVVHGRVYGHGVYHAVSYTNARGYCGAICGSNWQGARYPVSNCVVLNEIIHRPNDYRNRDPMFLVVQHPEWIQARYLLVQVNMGTPIELTAATDPPEGFQCRATEKPYYLVTDGIRGGHRKLYVPSPSSVQGNRFGIDQDSIKDLCRLFRERQERFQVERSFDTLELPLKAEPRATKAIHRELIRTLKSLQNVASGERFFVIETDAMTSLYQWPVSLVNWPSESPLGKDLARAKLDRVCLSVIWPCTFPVDPPFVRIVTPKFLPFMEGGGGHVTIGGSICMDLLTSSGWNPTYTFEAIMVSIRAQMLSDPPARLHPHGANGHYSLLEAQEAYRRFASRHGWRVPQMASYSFEFV